MQGLFHGPRLYGALVGKAEKDFARSAATRVAIRPVGYAILFGVCRVYRGKIGGFMASVKSKQWYSGYTDPTTRLHSCPLRTSRLLSTRCHIARTAFNMPLNGKYQRLDAPRNDYWDCLLQRKTRPSFLFH